MFCSECGNTVDSNAKFCGNCGNTVTSEAHAVEATPLTSNSQPINNQFVTKLINVVKKALVFILIFFGLAGIYFSLVNSHSKQTRTDVAQVNIDLKQPLEDSIENQYKIEINRQGCEQWLGSYPNSSKTILEVKNLTPINYTKFSASYILRDSSNGVVKKDYISTGRLPPNGASAYSITLDNVSCSEIGSLDIVEVTSIVTKIDGDGVNDDIANKILKGVIVNFNKDSSGNLEEETPTKAEVGAGGKFKQEQFEWAASCWSYATSLTQKGVAPNEIMKPEVYRKMVAFGYTDLGAAGSKCDNRSLDACKSDLTITTDEYNFLLEVGVKALAVNRKIDAKGIDAVKVEGAFICADPSNYLN